MRLTWNYRSTEGVDKSVENVATRPHKLSQNRGLIAICTFFGQC
jgi:hypothetical protein